MIFEHSLYFARNFKFFYCLYFPVKDLLLEMKAHQHYEWIYYMQDVLRQGENVLYIFPSNLADGCGIYEFQLSQQHDIIEEIEKYGMNMRKKRQSISKYFENVNGVWATLDFTVLFSDYFDIIFVGFSYTLYKFHKSEHFATWTYTFDYSGTDFHFFEVIFRPQSSMLQVNLVQLNRVL